MSVEPAGQKICTQCNEPFDATGPYQKICTQCKSANASARLAATPKQEPETEPEATAMTEEETLLLDLYMSARLFKNWPISNISIEVDGVKVSISK